MSSTKDEMNTAMPASVLEEEVDTYEEADAYYDFGDHDDDAEEVDAPSSAGKKANAPFTALDKEEMHRVVKGAAGKIAKDLPAVLVNDRLDVATKEFDCFVCWDAVQVGYASTCNHACCAGCWWSHVNYLLNNGGAIVALSCPVKGCAQHFGVDAVDLICGPESNQSRRFVERLVDTFVASHPQYRTCPSARGCEYTIRLEGVISLCLPAPVDCACGHRFCFHCGVEDHRPATCDMLRQSQWEAELAVVKAGEVADQQLIMATTKRCPGPHCGVAVEKNGGCEHMTCIRCRAEWCWFCLRPWSEHPDERCDETTTANSPHVLLPQSKVHPHAARFVSHKQSRSEVAILIKSRATTWFGDQAYLMAAAEVLAQCHHVLMYSYVYVYHLPDTKEKSLFEDLQSQLEDLVTRLSTYCGVAGDPSTIRKGDVVGATSIANGVLAKIQDGCGFA